jgi:hypothetical protein
MRIAFGYAWSKLYLAILAMTTSTAPLPERVASAFRQLGRDGAIQQGEKAGPHRHGGYLRANAAP